MLGDVHRLKYYFDKIMFFKDFTSKTNLLEGNLEERPQHAQTGHWHVVVLLEALNYCKQYAINQCTLQFY